MALLQLKDLLELSVKRFFSWFLSRRDMTLAAESNIKTHSLLPSEQNIMTGA